MGIRSLAPVKDGKNGLTPQPGQLPKNPSDYSGAAGLLPFCSAFGPNSDKRSVYRTRHSHRHPFGVRRSTVLTPFVARGLLHTSAHTGPDLCSLMFHLYGREMG